MKRLLLVLVLAPMLFLGSCEEGCDETIAPQISRYLKAHIWVEDQNGNCVNGYPTSFGFQKYWCDGDWAILVESQRNTIGCRSEVTSPKYELNNEEDYILVYFKIGAADSLQEYSTKVSYNEFAVESFVPNHHFSIVR